MSEPTNGRAEPLLEDRRLLRPVEAAKILAVSTRTLSRRRIRRVGFGSGVRYDREDIFAWIRKHREGARGKPD